MILEIKMKNWRNLILIKEWYVCENDRIWLKDKIVEKFKLNKIELYKKKPIKYTKKHTDHRNDIEQFKSDRRADIKNSEPFTINSESSDNYFIHKSFSKDHKLSRFG